MVSGGLDPERIRYFKDAGAPVDSYAVGSYISGATPIDFTGDIKEIDGQPIAKRGRIPGLTESPRLQPVDLARVPRGLGRRSATPSARPRHVGERDGSVRPSAHGATGPDEEPDERETAYELLQRGHALLDRRHHAQAAVVLERAAALEPRKGSILEALGRAYYNSGQSERARETFEALLEVDPSSHFGALRARPEPEASRPPERGRHASPARGRAEPRHRALPRRPRPAGPGPPSRAASPAAGPRNRRPPSWRAAPTRRSPTIDFPSLELAPSAAAGRRQGHPLQLRARPRPARSPAVVRRDGRSVAR